MANYYGTEYNDYIVAGSSNDYILGFAGDDILDGAAGNDALQGWVGNDSLIGGAGNDSLSGELDNDTLTGGNGNDILFGGLTDMFDRTDYLYGGDGNDTIYGGDGNVYDYVDGGTGTDTAAYYGKTFAESSISRQGSTVYVNGDTLINIEILEFSDLTISANSLNPISEISIGDVRITEGNSGIRNAVFTVRLDRSSQETVNVNYDTANSTASAGTDYNAARGTVRFNPGVINQTVSVGVKGDIILEPNETFNVNLSSATNASISDSLGVATIINDDIALPRLSINSLSVFEGNNRNNIALTVTLTGRTRQPVSVNFATANGSAISSSDYVRTTGNVAFGVSNAARQTKTIQIPIVGDSLFERDETFIVNLANAVNATLGTSRGTVTLKNDDNPPLRNSVMELSAFPFLDINSLGESKSSIIDKSRDFSAQTFAELAVNNTII